MLLLSRQFSGEQIGFNCEIVSPLSVAVLRCPFSLLHVALNLLHRVFLARGELTARDFLQIRISSGN